MHKFSREKELVDRLLHSLGYSKYQLFDPNSQQGRETGADVLVLLEGGRRIGVQVTEFDAGKGGAGKRGKMRNREGKKLDESKGTFTYTIAGSADPYEALKTQIGEKIKKANKYAFNEFNEIWLLVATSIPEPGAVASTYIWQLDADKLNNEFHRMLADCKYSKVFVQSMLEPKIYQRDRDRKWIAVMGDSLSSGSRGLGFKEILANREWLDNPSEKARAEALKVLEELSGKKISKEGGQD